MWKEVSSRVNCFRQRCAENSELCVNGRNSFSPCSLTCMSLWLCCCFGLPASHLHTSDTYLACSHLSMAHLEAGLSLDIFKLRPGPQICILFYLRLFSEHTQPWRLYSGSRTQTVKSGSSWADTMVEQGPLSSPTEQILACDTCSRLMKILLSSFILRLGRLFPEPSFECAFCPFRMHLNTCTQALWHRLVPF